MLAEAWENEAFCTLFTIAMTGITMVIAALVENDCPAGRSSGAVIGDGDGDNVQTRHRWPC